MDREVLLQVNRTVLRGRVLAGVALAALALAGCGGNDNEASPSTGSTAGGGSNEYADLSGAIKASGATFPDAYYQAVVEAFADKAPNVTVTYNGIGSSAGKKEFGQGLTDFAGTDSTVKDTDGLAKDSFLYVPTVAAPITVSYNLSGVDKLQLSPDTLAKIFQRDIKMWNDPAIAQDNPGVTLPAKNITVAHRSDGSGTTNNFTKYLDAASEAWKLGAGDTVQWPADTQGGEKNTGVANLIKNGDGGIGYVDMADAVSSGLKFAAIKNKDGQFVAASLEGATAALAGAQSAADLTYNPLNAAGATTYPITAPTYILIKTNYPDAAKAKLVKGFLKFLLTDGQALAQGENFAKLPDTLLQKALAQIEKIPGQG
jgi:phosphate transport system substrate-binding protein